MRARVKSCPETGRNRRPWREGGLTPSADPGGNPSDQCLQPVRVVRVEARGTRAVEIQHTDHRAIAEDRHDDFRGAGSVAGDVAGKGVDVRHKLRLARRRRGAAYTATQGDTDAGRLALKRPQHQLALHHAIKSRPVEVGQKLPEQRGDIGHVGNMVRLIARQRIGGGEQVGIERRLVGGIGGREVEHGADIGLVMGQGQRLNLDIGNLVLLARAELAEQQHEYIEIQPTAGDQYFAIDDHGDGRFCCNFSIADSVSHR